MKSEGKRRNDCFIEYLKYIILNVLGMLGLSCYILADTFFVANGLGNNGLAALNLALPVYSVIHGTGLMLGMGGASRYAVFKSQGRDKKKNEIFTQTILLWGCFAFLYVGIGMLVSKEIASMLGADEAVFDMCKTYLQVLLIFSPAFMLNDIMLCFVRNDGAPQLTMTAMLMGSFSNIVLDYVFIFLCRWGIFGAVFATGLSPIISLGVLSVFFIKKHNQFHLVKMEWQRMDVSRIFAGGLSSLVTELSSGIVMLLFNGIILQFRGNIGVAAYGVIANLALVVIAVYTGIAQGIQPLLSRDYGVGEWRNIRRIWKYTMWTIIGLSLLIYIGMFVGAEQITAIFNRDGSVEMEKLAVQGIKIYFLACVFAGYNIVLSIYFVAMDCIKPANLISLLRGFVLMIPITFLLSKLGNMTGLWFAFPATEAVVTLLGIRMWYVSKSNIRNGEKR